MRIIEIVASSNGAHRNQSGGVSVPPDGWAVIPDDMATPNFPFGSIETAEIDGIMTVTSWTAGAMPEPAPEPETDLTLTDVAQVAFDNAVQIELIRQGVTG